MTQTEPLATIADLMKYIGKRYTFTQEHYPILQLLSLTQAEAFAVSHSVHHMNKSLGKISAEVERFDHGGDMDGESLREGTTKLLINVLKLAEELGMSAEDLCEGVPRFMRSR